ncbi:hypothetical protein tb265_19180 [Gemmatimonadetes bacterium T265]|nr:hypothetical protein tb265_19180 [Gemmatimonadetes bacterium T265]
MGVLRAHRREGVLRPPRQIGLQGAAAHGPHGRAVGADEHAGRGAGERRAHCGQLADRQPAGLGHASPGAGNPMRDRARGPASTVHRRRGPARSRQRTLATMQQRAAHPGAGYSSLSSVIGSSRTRTPVAL